MTTRKSTVTYSLYSCINPNQGWLNKKWELEYQHLSEDDIRMIAKVYKFRKASIEKLITHKSKGFKYIRKKEYEIQKCFHKTDPEFMSISDARQPIRIQIVDLCKKIDRRNA